MQPGPILILKVPGCGELVPIATLTSGNTFGAVSWSDGKLEAEMLPDMPWLLKSPKEGVLFWRDECEEVGRIDWFQQGGHGGPGAEKPEWLKLKRAKEPSEADYFAALSNGVAKGVRKTRYVRLRLWWAGNDPVRRGEAGALTPLHLANLESLVGLLPESKPDHRLQKAEALRELARFDEATALLARPFPPEYARVVTRIRELTETKQTAVARLT